MSSNLTPRQTRAVMLIAAGQSNEGTAIAIGVAERTVNAWMRQDAFKDELKAAMERWRQMFEGRIFGLAANACVIVENMMRPDAPADVRAEGARLAINAAVKLVTRYKELQVEGFVPPPMFVLPAGSHVSTVPTTPEPPPPHGRFLTEGRVVDIDATHIEHGGNGNGNATSPKD